MTIVQREILAAIEIEVCLVAVKANLGGGSTKVVVGAVILVVGAIEVVMEIAMEVVIKVI